MSRSDPSRGQFLELANNLDLLQVNHWPDLPQSQFAWTRIEIILLHIFSPVNRSDSWFFWIFLHRFYEKEDWSKSIADLACPSDHNVWHWLRKLASLDDTLVRLKMWQTQQGDFWRIAQARKPRSYASSNSAEWVTKLLRPDCRATGVANKMCQWAKKEKDRKD